MPLVGVLGVKVTYYNAVNLALVGVVHRPGNSGVKLYWTDDTMHFTVQMA